MSAAAIPSQTPSTHSKACSLNTFCFHLTSCWNHGHDASWPSYLFHLFHHLVPFWKREQFSAPIAAVNWQVLTAHNTVRTCSMDSSLPQHWKTLKNIKQTYFQGDMLQMVTLPDSILSFRKEPNSIPHKNQLITGWALGLGHAWILVAKQPPSGQSLSKKRNA